MTMRTLFGRAVGTLVLAALLLVLVLILAGEATVAWYMHHDAITSRLELSED